LSTIEGRLVAGLLYSRLGNHPINYG
jgi:hypothetical protein